MNTKLTARALLFVAVSIACTGYASAKSHTSTHHHKARSFLDAGYTDGFSDSDCTVMWSGSKKTVLSKDDRNDGRSGASGHFGSQSSSEILALNDNGLEAGYSTNGKISNAMIWNGKKGTKLTSLGGTNSEAEGINNAGEAVGYSYTVGNTEKQAVLWIGSKVINLNHYLTSSQMTAGWVMENATGINDKGTIVGLEENVFTGKTESFVLNTIAAVPEPTGSAMFLLGLGLIGFTVRARKNGKAI